MDPGQIPLFDLADQRLAWSARRTAVLAQNIANSDTPGWRPQDLKSFADTLDEPDVTPVLTNPLHMAAPESDSALLRMTRSEHAPDGNAVSIDSTLVEIAETDTGHALVTDIYKKYLGMFRTAMGR